MATKNQITGGAFQDALGNPVANGYMLFELSQDAQVNGSTQLGAGRIINIDLDVNGNILGTQSVWPNDVLSPDNSFYNVSVYTANGQLVWGPNPQQVLSTTSPFNIGVWIPGAVNISDNLEGILLQTNSANNTSQIKLNLVQGSNITLTSDGGGDVTIASTGGGSGITSISVATADGLSGTSSGGSTPVLTLAADGTFARTNSNNEFSSGSNIFTGQLFISTQATFPGVNAGSGEITFQGSYTDVTTLSDNWSIFTELGAGTSPTSTLTLSHTGTSGSLSVSVPFPTQLGSLELTSATTGTSATSGSSTLPSNPLGFLETVINGTTVKIPYYSV